MDISVEFYACLNNNLCVSRSLINVLLYVAPSSSFINHTWEMEISDYISLAWLNINGT